MIEPMPIPLLLILIGVLGYIMGAMQTGTLAGGLELAGALLVFVIGLGAVIFLVILLYCFLTGEL